MYHKICRTTNISWSTLCVNSALELILSGYDPVQCTELSCCFCEFEYKRECRTKCRNILAFESNALPKKKSLQYSYNKKSIRNLLGVRVFSDAASHRCCRRDSNSVITRTSVWPTNPQFNAANYTVRRHPRRPISFDECSQAK